MLFKRYALKDLMIHLTKKERIKEYQFKKTEREVITPILITNKMDFKVKGN